MRSVRRCVLLPCLACRSTMNTSSRVTTFLLLSLVWLVLYTVWLQLETTEFRDYTGVSKDSSPIFVLRNGQWDTAPVEGPQGQGQGSPEGPGAVVSSPRPALHYCHLYNLSRPITADFRCVDMRTKPSTKVCLFESWRDMYVSHDLLHTGMWEPHVLYDFQDVLRRDSSLGVIDIGANIGVFSLLAAAMGHQVVAVEPNKESIWRLHKAANLSAHVGRITVVQNAVSDARGDATIRQNGDNQGDVRIEMGYKPCIGSCSEKVQTILLDDLLEVVTFDRAVIKIDSQGFEHRSFQHAEKLLDAVYVPYIYMEWLLMKEMYVAANHSSPDKTMVQNMIKLFLNRDYKPYMLDAHGAKVLNPNLWYDWPFDIVWRLKPNRKEYGKLLSNHFRIWP